MSGPTLVDQGSPRAFNKPSRGRPFGAKNIATASIRWGFVEAYRLLGGVDGLVKWGRRKPDLFYPLITKLLPAELAESGANAPIQVFIYGKELVNPKHPNPQPIIEVQPDTTCQKHVPTTVQPVDSIEKPNE